MDPAAGERRSIVTLLPAATLVRRELVRFLRERSRMIGVIASPILFWGVIGSGLNRSFQHTGLATGMNYLEYFFPGSVTLIVLFAAIFSSISVIEDRKEGFLQSVLVAPVTRLNIVLGKVGGITILALVQGLVFLIFAPLILPNVTAGSFFLAALVLGILSFGLSSFGFLIAWTMDSTQGFHAVMNLLLVPLWMLSGALFPASGASGWVASLMAWNPLSYGVAAVRMSLYGLDPHYMTDMPPFGVSVAITVLFALASSGLAVWRVTKRERGSTAGESGT